MTGSSKVDLVPRITLDEGAPFIPVISIIMPTHNSALYIEQSIRSVISQSYQSWELVIVDDASTDRTPELLRYWDKLDGRIVICFLQVNSGPAFARNRGLAIARGRYVAFLDSDDCWHPDKLDRQLAFMDRGSFAFTCTGFEIMDADGNRLGLAPIPHGELGYNDILSNCTIGCSTVMLDRHRLAAIQFPDMRSRQDFALWLNLLRDGTKAIGIPEILTQYRLSPSGVSRNKWRAARQMWKVYREHERFGFFKSFRCFLVYAWNGFLKHSRYRLEN